MEEGIRTVKRLNIVAVLVAIFANSTAYGGVILSNNLDSDVAGVDWVRTSYWQAASFGTDSQSYSLDSVTLLMRMPSAGAAQVDICSDDAGIPGTAIATLISPAIYPTDQLADTVFLANGISLDPTSTYWVVLKAVAGEFYWAFAKDNTGSGAGFQHTWGYSEDSGSTWEVSDEAPDMMAVEASPASVPEPTTLAIWSTLGALGLITARRRRRAA